MSNSGHKRVVFTCFANCLTRKESMERVKVERIDPRSRLSSILDDSSEEISNSGIVDQVRVNHTKHWLENLSTFVNLDPLSSVDTIMQDSSCSCDSAMEHNSALGGNDVKMSDEICSRERRSTVNGCSCSACQVFSRDEVRFISMTKKLEDQCSCSAATMDTYSCQLCSGQKNPRNHLSLQIVDSKNVEQMSLGCSSSASISLATELVTLDMNLHHHLGITVVGHSIKKLGDCGIFVGCVKRGGAAAISGHIDPGDLILEINGIDLESLSNEQAVRVLREELAKGGIVQLLVIKCWNLKSENTESMLEGPVYERIETQDPSSSSKFHMPSTGARRASHQSGKSKLSRQFNEGSGRSEKEIKVVHSPSYISPSLRVVPAVVPCLKNASRISSSTPIQNDGMNSGLHKLQLSDILSYSRTCGTYTNPGCRTNKTSVNRPSAFLGSDFLEWIQSHDERHLSRKSAISYADWLLQTGYIRNTGTCANRNFNENLYYRLGSQLQPVH